MRYVSTRGQAPVLEFGDVLLAGLATDGGLYVPESYPRLPELPLDTPYAALAAAVMQPYVEGSVEPEVLASICRDAYGGFRHPAVVPLVQLDTNEWVCELFWGPTLAFKDVALQVVGRLFDHVLGRRGRRVTIVTATSGDTGGAAIDAALGQANIDVVVLFPNGRVSDVQRRQMTTVDAPNVHAVAVEGDFDDCQDLVKAMFADAAFREAVQLGAMNSINWARVMAQVVYYYSTARQLGGGLGGRPISFAVPTGNFGNVLAGWVAGQMGLPVDQLVVGSNRNDILTRWLETGEMRASGVTPSLSPSMDIQVSSNVERLLFELNGRDGGLTAEQMQRFRATGSLAMEPDQHAAVSNQFSAARLDDEGTLALMGEVYRTNEMLLDPHSAVGLHAARACWRDRSVPMVSMATAHPAKFPDAVHQATGHYPPLPDHLAGLLERPEQFTVLANDLATVEAFITAAVHH
ncbi:MAG: threonine synthase [Acidimicrobiia bacterium]|nr:threonine synthase [Acidimicrobiia bacterium]